MLFLLLLLLLLNIHIEERACVSLCVCVYVCNRMLIHSHHYYCSKLPRLTTTEPCNYKLQCREYLKTNVKMSVCMYGLCSTIVD